MIGKLIITVVALTAQIAIAETHQLDLAKSSFKWVGKKVTGQHDGNVKFKSGSVTFTKGKLSGGTFTLDMNTISNNDVKSDEWRQKLVAHLKSDDFFNVKGHPTASFVIKKAKPSKIATEWDVTGDLTVKGITKSITFRTTIKQTGKLKVATAKFKIDRSRWDIKYKSGKFFDPKELGDKLIYDDIEIELSLQTKGKTGKKS